MKNKEVTKVSDYIDIVKELTENQVEIAKEQSQLLNFLKENNYIAIDSSGYITLTEFGINIATQIYEKHVIISKFLMSIGVPEAIALEDACKLEHDLSEESFEAIKKIITTKE